MYIKRLLFLIWIICIDLVVIFKLQNPILILFFFYSYTGRRLAAVDHFMQALVVDPLFWAAYEELCILGQLLHVSSC